MTTADKLRARMTTEQMILGLVRYAELREQDESGGTIWDDESRLALKEARARGWGSSKVGTLSDAEPAAERRVFVGTVQAYGQGHRIVDKGRYTFCEDWCDMWEGKRVRITVEVLPVTPGRSNP